MRDGNDEDVCTQLINAAPLKLWIDTHIGVSYNTKFTISHMIAHFPTNVAPLWLKNVDTCVYRCVCVINQIHIKIRILQMFGHMLSHFLPMLHHCV